MKTVYKLIFVISILLINFIPQTSSSSISLDKEEVIVYATPYDLNKFSIFEPNPYSQSHWINAVYSGLVKRSSVENGDWVPDLANSMPEISENGLTFSFLLRSDIYFSNGFQITSEDIEFSLKASLTPEINKVNYGRYRDFLSNQSLTIKSSYQFSITLLQNHPFPYTILSFGIVPKDVFNSRYENCLDGVLADCSWNNPDGSDAISGGPFKVTNIDLENWNNVITLEANPYWYNADKVFTDKLIFQRIQEKGPAISALADGSIHIMDSNYVPGLTELDAYDGILDSLSGDLGSIEMAINHKHPYFGTGELIPNSINATEDEMNENALQLRRAMSLIMDRERYVTESMDGLALAAATNMPAGSIGWDSNLQADPYNVSSAKLILEQLGFNYTSLGNPDVTTGKYSKYFFSISVLSPGTGPAGLEPSADYVQQLPKIGIGVTQHRSTGWAEIVPRTFGSEFDPPLYDEGGFDVFFVGYSWNLDWNPLGLFDGSGSCSTGNCGNFYNFDLNETMTPIGELVRAYISSSDFDIRLDYLKLIQEQIYNWLPTIPIFHRLLHWGWSDDVNGIDFSLLSVYLQEWDQVTRSGFSANLKEDISTNGAIPISFPILFFLAAIPVIVILKNKQNLI